MAYYYRPVRCHHRFVFTALSILTLLLLGACAANAPGTSPRDAGQDASLDAAPGSEPDAGRPCQSDRECNDGIACTIDHCEDGVCKQTPCEDCCPNADEVCIAGRGCGPARQACTDHSDCSDGIGCTIDRCVDGSYCEHRPEHGLCPDDEQCYPGLGCSEPPAEICSEDEDCGSFCSGRWKCEGEFACQYLGPRNCDDGDPCTVDRCDPETDSCVHEPLDADGDGYGPIACGGTDCDDDDPDVHPGASEICDGRDQNCDGVADEDFECAAGASEPCTTSCGTTGMRVCSASCTFGQCAPPAEVCNEIDDDCDGRIDEGGMCATGTCGAAGRRSTGALGDLRIPAGETWTLDTSTGTITGSGGATFLAASLSAPPSTASSNPGVEAIAQTGPHPIAPPQIAVFHFHDIEIGSGATLRVTGARALALLGTGSINVLGTIDASGSNGTAGQTNSPGAGGSAGPGGFDGGTFLTDMGCPGGNGSGRGPGAGTEGECGASGNRGDNGDSNGSGAGGGGSGCSAGGGAGGSFATSGQPGSPGASGMDGATGGNGPGVGGRGGAGCSSTPIGGFVAPTYGDERLEPLYGGSGGGTGGFGGMGAFGGNGGNGGGLGGSSGFGGGPGGGGGGGGAVLLCSDTEIIVAGGVNVRGGNAGTAGSGDGGQMGSKPVNSLQGPRGGGGGGGAGGAAGGSGGGSGGAIVLDAPSVQLSGQLVAAGGHGSSGGFMRTGASGASGNNGGGQGGRGGNGGAGGSGGNGGNGRIFVRSPSFANTGTVSGVIVVNPI